MVLDNAERQIRAWLDDFVVGLDLCPFARPLLHSSRLRISVSAATKPAQLHAEFLRELDVLQSSSEDEIATTLLAFPCALELFDDFLDYLDGANELLLSAGLEGVVQLASFHPQYQFEGTEPGDAENFSNRSPYPMIHFLRENMLTRSLADFPQPEGIPQRNIATLDAIGSDALRRRWKQLLEN